MCGRFALGLRPSQVRRFLEDEDLPVYDAPADDADDAPRQSYNFAPGYHGIVYRANVPDTGAGTRSRHHGEEAETGEEEETGDATDKGQPTPSTDGDAPVQYKLQSMKWGLIPFWTKRNPDYGSMMKTINCRDDSLIDNKGMWTSMKNKKRCVVVAQGFYEWLKKGPKEKVPHYTKRKDGGLMYFAGLWDCVQYEGEEKKHYTFTIITTSSNKQLNFLHDRMPVILEKNDIKTWLDPQRSEWTKELQSLLKPSKTEFDCYPVSKEVGKVGNNSPNFIIPVASSENKQNIANFFGNASSKKGSGVDGKKEDIKKEDVKDQDVKDQDIKEATVKEDSDEKSLKQEENKLRIKKEPDEDRKTVDHEGTEDNAPLPIPKQEDKKGVKRELDEVEDEDLPRKQQKTISSPEKASPTKVVRRGRSATSNKVESPSKTATIDKGKGNKKITNFFTK